MTFPMSNGNDLDRMAQRLEAASPWRPVSDLPALTHAQGDIGLAWRRLQQRRSRHKTRGSIGCRWRFRALFHGKTGWGIPEAIRHGNTLSRSCVDSLTRSAVVSRKRTSSGGSKKGYIDYDVERQIPLRIEDKIYTAVARRVFGFGLPVHKICSSKLRRHQLIPKNNLTYPRALDDCGTEIRAVELRFWRSI
jgi:hypothetical protein